MDGTGVVGVQSIISTMSFSASVLAKHELAHALGFTAGTIPYFRDPLSENSAPRTTRGADGKPAEQANTCADGNTVTLATPASTTRIVVVLKELNCLRSWPLLNFGTSTNSH